jgi:hypothetical protein
MTSVIDSWRPTDEITNPREFELRVCTALAPNVVRHRPTDMPFINGYRLDFWTFSKLPRSQIRWTDSAICQMSDVTDSLYVCLLVSQRKLRLIKWCELVPIFSSTALMEGAYSVRKWGDVIARVENLFLNTLPTRPLPWAIGDAAAGSKAVTARSSPDGDVE